MISRFVSVHNIPSHPSIQYMTILCPCRYRKGYPDERRVLVLHVQTTESNIQLVFPPDAPLGSGPDRLAGGTTAAVYRWTRQQKAFHHPAFLGNSEAVSRNCNCKHIWDGHGWLNKKTSQREIDNWSISEDLNRMEADGRVELVVCCRIPTWSCIRYPTHPSSS